MIIGFCGLSGSGKDTAAEHLARNIRNGNYRACIISLADTLKEITNDTCHLLRPECEMDRAILWGDAKTKNTYEIRDGLTVRTFLQYFGTEILRKHLGNDVFINALCARISQIATSYDVILIPDVRFLNEMRGLLKYSKEKKYQMWMVHIIRDDVVRMKHASEGNASLIMDVFEDENPYASYRTLKIHNNGDKDKLYSNVDEFYKRLDHMLSS